MTTTLFKPDHPQDDVEAPAQKKRKPSRFREIATSILILGMLVTAVLSSIPGSTIKREVAPLLVPIARVTGLDQSWGMFAPNPPRSLSQIEVHVIMSDGTDRVWRPEDDESMRRMQWRKLKEELIKSKDYRLGLARWVVDKMTTEGERPVRVAILVEQKTLPLPGEGDPKTAQRLIFDQKASSYPPRAQK